MNIQHFNRLIVGVGAIGLLAVTGCGGKKEAEIDLSPQKVAVPSAPNIAGAANPAALMGAVTDTKAAIAKGDYSAAGKALDKFSGVWKTAGPMVEKTNPKVFATINGALPKLEMAIKAKDAAGAKSALTGLETAMSVLK
jgi:hypothetical protein